MRLPIALAGADLLATSTGEPLAIHFKAGARYWLAAPNPASFGAGYPQLPPANTTNVTMQGSAQLAAAAVSRECDTCKQVCHGAP